jgi:hypothetical protein
MGYFLLWTDENISGALVCFFKNRGPLYACCGPNYVLITKILSKQIYSIALSCSVSNFMDIYIYEMGGVLVGVMLMFLKNLEALN